MRPACRPITTTTLHKVLTNPYYQGTVTFRGLTYDGAHTPLVDSETWIRVQAQLDAKNAVGERPQKYDHYLKGSLYCSCGAKLMIERPRDKNGVRYEYFTCSGGRPKRTRCTRPRSSLSGSSSASKSHTTPTASQRTKPNGYRTCCTGCSTSSKPPATTNANSSKPRRTSSKQNDSSSSRPTTPTRSLWTCSRASRNASAPASTRSPDASTP